MPYVQRDQAGKIVGVYARMQPGYAEELLAPDSPDLLAPAAASARARINRARDEAIDSGVPWGGHLWDSDARSQLNLTGAISSFRAGVAMPAGFTWRTRDNVDVPMQLPDLIGLAGALLSHVNAQYIKSWNLKAELEAAATQAELDAVQW